MKFKYSYIYALHFARNLYYIKINNMLRKLLSTLTVIVASAGFVIAQNEGALKVKLFDKANNETIPFANVVVEMGGIQAGIGTTNIDGEIVIKPLNPGRYNIKATYVGYQTVEVKDITVSIGKTAEVKVAMTAGRSEERRVGKECRL